MTRERGFRIVMNTDLTREAQQDSSGPQRPFGSPRPALARRGMPVLTGEQAPHKSGTFTQAATRSRAVGTEPGSRPGASGTVLP